MASPTYRIPGLELTELRFTVPLDYSRPRGEQISVFCRAVVAPDKAGADLPWLVFFQGGPGSPSPRPETNTGWLHRALQDYRVLLLDQRGTGLSTPVTHQTLARRGSPQAQADYLRQFRADNIVADAEFIRRELVGADGKWSVLGQSFGGFCVTHYLSVAGESLSAAYLTGGLAPVGQPIDEIYRATYRRVLDRNRRYYERYPEDIARAHEIVEYLATHDVRMPGGGRLSPRRFQQLGQVFGMSYGFEQLHYLLEYAFVEGAGGRELSYMFLLGAQDHLHFEANPIYALLHEAEYLEGAASRWSAERVRGEYPEFTLAADRPVYFTGEMIYPWMFEDYELLRPMAEAAELLAQYEDWPALYNPAALAANTVPAAAALYYDDMYVEARFSEETARMIHGLRVWVTNEYDHNGLRADGERILDRLIAMARGNA